MSITINSVLTRYVPRHLNDMSFRINTSGDTPPFEGIFRSENNADCTVQRLVINGIILRDFKRRTVQFMNHGYLDFFDNEIAIFTLFARGCPRPHVTRQLMITALARNNPGHTPYITLISRSIQRSRLMLCCRPNSSCGGLKIVNPNPTCCRRSCHGGCLLLH